MAARQDALQYNRTRASRRHLGSSIEALGVKIDPGTNHEMEQSNSGNTTGKDTSVSTRSILNVGIAVAHNASAANSDKRRNHPCEVPWTGLSRLRDSTGTWGRQGNKDSFAFPLLFLFNALALPGLLRVLETPIGIILDPHRPYQPSFGP
jgi:hypothetical protein